MSTAIELNLLFRNSIRDRRHQGRLDLYLILWVEKLGFRWSEAFFVRHGVIAICFGFQIAMAAL